jgi:hypothetical protein
MAPLAMALLLIVNTGTAHPAGVSDGLAPMARQLDKIGRELCLSLRVKCRAATRHATKAASSQRTPSAVQSPIPIPHPKPAIAAAAPAAAPPQSKPVELPKERSVRIPSTKSPTVQPKDAVVQPASLEQPPSIPQPDCLASLRNAKVVFETVPPPAETSNCHVEEPVRLHAVQTLTGEITLPDTPILNCRFAKQFALWLSDAGAGIVSSHMNSRLMKISTGPGYQCRARNGDSSAKLSEHAFGNAVDITTLITADGRTVQVSDAINTNSPSFETLRGLRTTACGYFATVLGPGANEAHVKHFHFDLAVHGKSANYRICE